MTITEKTTEQFADYLWRLKSLLGSEQRIIRANNEDETNLLSAAIQLAVDKQKIYVDDNEKMLSREELTNYLKDGYELNV